MARSENQRAATPGAFLAALAVGAGFLTFVAWDQSHWWRVKEDYAFGWLVPILVVYVVRDRWPSITATLSACAADGSPRVAGGFRWTLALLIGASLVSGMSMFLLGAFYRAGWGVSQPGTLEITLGAVGILLPLVFLNAPTPGSGAEAKSAASTIATRWLDDPRVRLASLFVFPILVWLVSAPLVSAMETRLNVFLLGKVVTAVAFVFDLLGLPLEQQGNVLALPNGNVGVEEACSGIRSLTGCLFAGSFLSAVFLDRAWRKIALIAAALLLAFMANLARSLFLTGWAYRYGPAAIEGRVHDVAGYAVLALTIVGLFALLPLFNLKLARKSVVPAGSRDVNARAESKSGERKVTS